jgi:thiamine pyrophosphokinase
MILQMALTPAYRDGSTRDDGTAGGATCDDAPGGETVGAGASSDDAPDVVIEDGGVRIFLAKRGQWIEGKIGSYLSIFALSPEVTGFTQSGLKYQPVGGRFVSSFPLGISNEFIEEKACLNWEKGVIMCMQVDK